MYVVLVTPIIKGAPANPLTYFSARPPRVGMIITVPLRGRKIRALVLEVSSATAQKASLKDAPFATKKVINFSGKLFFHQTFIEALKEAAEYFVSSPGELLASLVSRHLFSEKCFKEINFSARAESFEKSLADSTKTSSSAKFLPLLLHDGEEERYLVWKNLIRESFAKGESLIIIVPNRQEAMRLYEYLEKGISEYAYLLHGDLSEKKFLHNWQSALSNKHPVLMVGTRLALPFPRGDVATLILDRESARGWKTLSRPYADLRTVAEIYARRRGLRLIYGGQIVRPETYARFLNYEITELAKPKFRLKNFRRQILLDMRKRSNDFSWSFSFLNNQLAEFFQTTAKEDLIFLFVARRGLYPVTVCGDCGSLKVCPMCSRTLVLYNEASERNYRCHHCGFKEKLSLEKEISCSFCGSWKLSPIGVGIDAVKEEVVRRFPDRPIYLLESGAGSQKQLEKVALEWQKTGGILLGTEFALPYLPAKIFACAIVSLDALFSVPDFRMHERIIMIASELSRRTDNFFIQTRNPEARIFSYIESGVLTDYYKDELAERKEYDYPPLATLIRLSSAGPEPALLKTKEMISDRLGDREKVFFFGRSSAGKKVLHTLIRVKIWPDWELLNILYGFPSGILIQIDPDSIFD